MTGLKGVRGIASIWILSAGLVLSTGLSGNVVEVSAEESVKVLNKYQEAHITRKDVLKALEGYTGDRSRNGLMEYGLKTGDMSLFHAVDAMYRPAFYDIVNGKFVKNKFYYGALIDKHIQSIDQYFVDFSYATGIQLKEKEDKRLWELVEKYKKAPGLIPYVIGFTNTKQNADKYGVEETPIDFFNSKWNHPDVMTKGRFSNKDNVITENKREEGLKELEGNSDFIYEKSAPIEESPLEEDEIIPEQPEVDNGDGAEGEKDVTEDESIGDQETDEQIGGIDSKFGKDHYFEKIEWIDRQGTISLSIYPKFPAFKKENGKLDEQRIQHSFDVIESEYGIDEKWNNTNSMRMQYECHVYFAGEGKVPWNIEPHRTESRFLETVLKSCNP
ncbi:DUF2599 domain-containing protein [Sporosarcina sp. SAFN-015]|uniref:DUF2599 domain-containing protein n=1 Tax=Sporosarcina sp. SAFN-015 TaxID=3387274 RepID=UPI003F815AF9